MDEKHRYLESLTGHHFLDQKRLTDALTHSSARSLKEGNYERLEFLGDRVLGLLISEMLCRFFPNASEGELSIRLNGLVNAETCAEIAIEAKLPPMIVMSPEMRNLEGRRLLNTYADVVEALIAVIYLEGGLNAVRPFIERFWEQRAKQQGAGRRDAKTELQEWAHQQNGSQPVYRVLKRTGPDHDPIFEVEVRLSGFAPQTARGSSKRAAERGAAEALLKREGVWYEVGKA